MRLAKAASRWAFYSLLLCLCWSGERKSAAATVGVQVTLRLDTKDVTKEHRDAVVLFQKQNSSASAPETRIRCSVGVPCEISSGRYVVDLESEELVPDVRPTITIGENEPASFGLDLHVTPSALIEIPGARFPSGAYLSAIDERTGTLHSRKVNGDVARLRVPGRRVLLCAYESGGNPIACASMAPAPRSVLKLPALFQPGRNRGQVLIGLTYQTDTAPWDAKVTLRVGDRTHRPDFVAQRHSRVYVAWLDAPAGSGELVVESLHWTLAPPVIIRIPERQVGLGPRISLSRKPDLKVSLLGAAVLGPGDVELDLFSCGLEDPTDQLPPLGKCVLRVHGVAPSSSPFEFRDLDPEVYALRWRKPPFESVSWVDLRDGKSREHAVQVEITEVRGRITHRKQGVAARLRLEAFNTGSTFDARSESDGRYSLRVAQLGRHFLRIRTEGGALFNKTLVVGNPDSYDVEIPSNSIRVNVLSNGVPVPRARVAYEIRSPPNETQQEVGFLETDSEGSVMLPPLSAGTLRVRASAKGFIAAVAQPLAVTEGSDETIAVTLKPGDGVVVRILDPSGAPASRAVTWSEATAAVADELGVAVLQASLPRGAPLVTFDISGNMGFFRYSGDEEQVVQIPRPGPPIVVRFLSPENKPLAGRNVFLGVDGVIDDRRFLNQALQAGGDPLSRPDGTLRVAGVPPNGEISIWPAGRPDLAVMRRLPVSEEIVFTLPATRP